MKLWPRDSFEIRTNLPHMEAVARVQSRVRPKLPIDRAWRQYIEVVIYRVNNEWWEPNEDPRFHKDFWFAGELSTEGFKLRRIKHFASPLLPIVTGTFSLSEDGDNVTIRMRLPAWVIGLLILWFARVGFLVVLSAIGSVPASRMDPGRWIGASLIFVSIYSLLTLAFWSEAKKQRIMLRELLGDPRT